MKSVLVMSVGLALCGCGGGSTSAPPPPVSVPSADATAEELTPREFSVLSRVLHKKEPIQDVDLNSVREMVNNYVSRTGHPISRQDVATLTGAVNTSTAYYYELAKSRLLSWDSEQYQTTKEFDRLYAQMEQDGGRKPVKLANDKNRIRVAARHESVEKDEGGLEYELSRDSILRNLDDIKISADNVHQVISVLNELVR